MKKIITLFSSVLFIISLCFCTNSAKANKIDLKTPPYLKEGDTISILAPAGILMDKKQVVNKAKEMVESWGLKVVLGENIFNQNNHFAGTDEERKNDFQKALDNPNIKAIWCARGGYGSVRILDKLNFTEFKKNPKWIIGYSDITAFHSHLNNLGIETIHSMMPISLEDYLPNETIESFKKSIFGEKLKYKIPSSKYNRIGEVSGELIGGNISILTSMLGSESRMNTGNKILFIEEIGEYKYSIDRMLQSLKRAGYFKNLKAIIVGDISNIKKNTPSWGSSIEELILNVVPKNIPILFNFPAGHELDNRALILGRTINLKIDEIESVVEFKN